MSRCLTDAEIAANTNNMETKFIVEIMHKDGSINTHKSDCLEHAISIIMDFPNSKYILTEVTVHNVYQS